MALISDIGRVLCLPVNEAALPLMGKLAQGPMTMRVLPGETLVGAISSPAHTGDDGGTGNGDTNRGTVLIGSRNGALMQLDLASLRLCRRGDLGDMALNLDGTGHDPDRVVTVSASAELVGVVSSKGRHGRLLSNTISNDLSQPTQLPLKGDEHLSELIPLLTLSLIHI